MAVSDPVEPELTWTGWAKGIDEPPLTREGSMTLAWAVDVVRDFLGETWLADNKARTGFVPLLTHQWWPIYNERPAVRVIELAARIVLVTAAEDTSELLREAKEIYPNRDLVRSKFEHLCLTLETAAFATLAGWTVSYEKTTTSGRRPDLTMSRGATNYAVDRRPAQRHEGLRPGRDGARHPPDPGPGRHAEPGPVLGRAAGQEPPDGPGRCRDEREIRPGTTATPASPPRSAPSSRPLASRSPAPLFRRHE